MILPFPDEDHVPAHVGGNHEQRVLVAAYCKPLPLAVGEELGALVLSRVLPEAVAHVARLFGMVTAGTVGLGDELHVGIIERRGQH